MTLQPQQDQGGGFGGPGGGGGNRDLLQANQSVITDLSKLGKPGTHFVHDFFLPGTQLTFQQTAAKQIAAIDGVAQVTQGLTLLAEHQEGVVPKIVAKLKTGGQTFQIRRNLPRPTAAQAAAMQACIAKLQAQERRLEQQRRRAARSATAAAAAASAAAVAASTAARSRSACRRACASSARNFTTPTQTLKQVLDPPQTNIKTTAYTIGGVDQTNPTMGVVTESQVTKGRYPRDGRRS